MKALPLFVVVLLVVSPVLAAADSGGVANQATALDGAAFAQTQPPANETIRVLDITEDSLVQSTVESENIDLGPSLDFAALRAGGQIQKYASIQRIESVGDDVSLRSQLILGELNRVEQRAIALQSAQQSAITQYNADELSSRELLVELARIDAEARDLDDRRIALRELATETPDFSVDPGRLAALERELDTFTGPVRAHATDVLSGNADPTRFSVRTSQDGVVLSTVTDDSYIREVYRGDLRNRDESGLSPTVALDTVAGSYPEVWESRATQNGADVVGAGNSYLVRINHDRGQLFAYVDSGSENVFKEAQIRPLDSVSRGTPATEVKDGLNLTVYRTYPGGPLRIQLNESASDDPIDANVTIGVEASQESTLLGRTGPDGAIWTVSPSSPYTITVIRGNAAVVLTTSPTPTPELSTNTSAPSNSTTTNSQSTPPTETTTAAQ
ncbi:hypothetical protein GJR98_02010 [Haloferax sp. MBLA0077]|uniref:Uncharacterized protein n=3 Tax=Haloferacaceae TaxID=1644056 RepID=A0A6G1YZ27_9EURY|nr:MULTISPECIES: hypothetical protein [Haloferax]KAB1189198.1 hypothetical protein Hfx1149_02005 [Haloferax sp. CBA1149]MRW79495.1 hypothetical protein [Haloferax marinisediminis]